MQPIGQKTAAGSRGFAVAFYGLLLAMTGCATTISNTAPTADRWTTAIDESCRRFVVSWHVPMDLLEDIVGPNFAPARIGSKQAGDKGRLLVLVEDCPASQIGQAATGPLTVAHVMIPLSSGTTPRLVSGVPQDGWSSVPLTVAGRAGVPVVELFRRHGFIL